MSVGGINSLFSSRMSAIAAQATPVCSAHIGKHSRSRTLLRGDVSLVLIGVVAAGDAALSGLNLERVLNAGLHVGHHVIQILSGTANSETVSRSISGADHQLTLSEWRNRMRLLPIGHAQS